MPPFFTDGRALGAMLGGQGNFPSANILFCVQHVIKPEEWCPTLVTIALWSLNGDIALMMVLNMLVRLPTREMANTL